MRFKATKNTSRFAGTGDSSECREEKGNKFSKRRKSETESGKEGEAQTRKERERFSSEVTIRNK